MLSDAEFVGTLDKLSQEGLTFMPLFSCFNGHGTQLLVYDSKTGHMLDSPRVTLQQCQQLGEKALSYISGERVSRPALVKEMDEVRGINSFLLESCGDGPGPLRIEVGYKLDGEFAPYDLEIRRMVREHFMRLLFLDKSADTIVWVQTKLMKQVLIKHYEQWQEYTLKLCDTMKQLPNVEGKPSTQMVLDLCLWPMSLNAVLSPSPSNFCGPPWTTFQGARASLTKGEACLSLPCDKVNAYFDAALEGHVQQEG